jgi:leucyl-tRNA synthetase
MTHSPADDTKSASPAATAERDRPHRYDAKLAHAIETKWQQFWDEHQTFRTPNPGEPGFQPAKPKYYVLDMFPYPSGKGLHVGHPEGYTATDIVARYKRHRGFNVLHPMGWDAFGLPAEQYAIQTGIHPAETTRKSIDTFRRQLKRFGFCYDWSREFATIDPDYYKWTQWIWLKAYHSWYDPEQKKARPIHELINDLDSGQAACGLAQSEWKVFTDQQKRDFIDAHRLAYLAEQTVNWCPKLGTALANEEVIDGRSERGGFPVYRKPLKQWMFRITAYADRLLEDLDLVEWPESTRAMQTEWIGRSEGAEIDFPIARSEIEKLRVFTTRPDTVFGATYMVVAPEHPLIDLVLKHPQPETDPDQLRAYVEAAKNKSDVDRQADVKEKTGVFTGVHATNPATGEQIPVWTSDYVLMGYGHGAIMAVPGHDERDFQFALKFDLPIAKVVEPATKPTDSNPWSSDNPREWETSFDDDGIAVNSANDEVSLNGLPTAEAKQRIIQWLEEAKLGTRKINYRLRDWLFSRQRYWGEPFPIVFDEDGNHYPIAEEHLPVELPPLKDFQPIESDEPMPLLAKAKDWVKTTAGEAGVSPDLLPPGTPVTRETNTMPGWAGSCWYELRFCDPKNDERFVSREAEAYWSTPGRAMVDLYIGGAEHAVLHLLYARFWHKVLYDLGEVSTPEPFAKLFHQGMIVSFAYSRADKSLVPIDEVEEREEGVFIETATGERVTQVIAKMSKSLKNIENPDHVIAEFGADTFRLYEMYMGPLEATKPWNTRDIAGCYRFLQRVWRLVVNEETGDLKLAPAPSESIEKLLHRTIKKVGDDIERLAFNTAIAAMIEFTNAATSAGGVTRDQLERFAVILSPFAPHMAEELWSKLGREPSIANVPWPSVDQAMLRDDEIELPVQILGKVRGRVTVPTDADQKQVEQIALADQRIAAQLEGRTVRKVIVVPGKIVNIIAN